MSEFTASPYELSILRQNFLCYTDIIERIGDNMRSVTPVKAAKIGYIVISAVLCALGIFFIAKPAFSIFALGIICGIMLIIFGAVKLIGFFSKDLYRLAFQYDLAYGILLIVLGAMMLLHPESMMNFICIAIGISVLADGLFKVQIAMDSKKFGIRGWWLILIFAVLTGLGGGILIFRSSTSSLFLTIFIGICMLTEGILNLITVLTTVKIIRHQQPDMVEITYTEETQK